MDDLTLNALFYYDKLIALLKLYIKDESIIGCVESALNLLIEQIIADEKEIYELRIDDLLDTIDSLYEEI